MSTDIATVAIADEQDVVHARQRARLIAELLGFDRTDQTRLSTAVSEIARNAFLYAGGGTVAFALQGETPPQILAVTVCDEGPGIQYLEAVLAGTYASRTGMGMGLIGTRRLMDHFLVEVPEEGGTTVFFGKRLPENRPPVTAADMALVAERLVRERTQSPLEEVKLQNQELLRALEELRERQDDLLRLNAELEDTNRGVLALYAELDDKATQLARANELKARFLSGMSHEFRTPLNSILALSELLLERADGDLTAEQQKQVTFIRRGAEDLSELVGDLLDLARIEAGKSVVRPRSFSAAELLSGLRGMFKPLAVKDGVELVIEEPDPRLPAFFTDDGKLSQILRNFLSNALKFTDRGAVRLSLRQSGDGTAAVFAVSDTGVGIAAPHLEHIFDEYAQVEGPTGRPSAGTGLGLPISRHLAELLGGRVTVESRLGRGSTFTATVPWRFAEAAEEGAGEEHQAASGPSRGEPESLPVLLVEDDAATRLVYESYLRGSGFSVMPATTLEEARALLKSARPAAIVLDILMGEGDSWWFLADVKADPATRELPVIITSVLEEEAKGLAMGADDYCVKPVERDWLLSRLRELAQRAPVETILIIDDEQVARYILKGHLAGTHYHVLEASSGAQGLELATRRHPDVVFLDLMMPGMNGFEVLKRLKEDPATREIPVIISTSRSLNEAERHELDRSALAVLSKRSPSRAAALDAVGEALRRALPRRAPRAGEVDA